MHSEGHLESTRVFWSKKYGGEITTEDAREITRNISGFFDVLSKWAAEDHMRTVTSNGELNHE